jgi:hypothetical protein
LQQRPHFIEQKHPPVIFFQLIPTQFELLIGFFQFGFNLPALRNQGSQT